MGVTLPFVIRGEVTAETREQALDRVMRMLRVVGFADVGDGSLWLNRPSGPMDDVGMALGEDTYSVTSIEIGEPA